MNIARLHLLAFAALSLLALPIAPAQAQERNACDSWFRLIQTRDGDPLNMRKEPNGQVMGTVPNGSEVLFNTGDRTGDWSQVTLKGGKTGWVADRFLSRHSVDAATFDGKLRIKTLDGDSVALRADAGTGAKALKALQPGDVVTQIEDVGYWTHVRTSNGLQGFISSQYLVCR